MQSTEIPPTIRPAREGDAAAVAAMVAALSAYHGSNRCAFTPEHFLRDGIGPDRCFDMLVAESRDELVGYAFYHQSYDSETARRGSYLMDLYVHRAARRLGAGRALLAGVVRATRASGGEVVWWLMARDNDLAENFYRRIAAREPGWEVWVLADDRFDTLANPDGGRPDAEGGR